MGLENLGHVTAGEGVAFAAVFLCGVVLGVTAAMGWVRRRKII